MGMSRVRRGEVARCLHAGGVIAYPTEGVFGLGCIVQREPVERILALKARPAHKGLILLAAAFDQLAPWLAPVPEPMRSMVQADWPGPVTWLLPAATGTPDWLNGGGRLIAVRVTAHPGARELAIAAKSPLISTSANPSGRPPARSALMVRGYFDVLGCRGVGLTSASTTGIDLIVPGRLGGLGRPTAIRCWPDGRFLRPG